MKTYFLCLQYQRRHGSISYAEVLMESDDTPARVLDAAKRDIRAQLGIAPDVVIVAVAFNPL